MSAEAIDFNAEELTLLYRVARTLLGERDYGELLADLLDATIEGLRADRGFVVVREGGPEESRFRAAVARNFKSEALTRAEEEVSGSISAAVIEHGRAMLVGDALASDRFRENPSVKRLGLRSVLCAPLVASNEAFALIYLENRDVTNRFTERHRELMDEICGLAAPRLRTAIAIELARKRARELESSLGETDGIITADAGMAAVMKTVRQVAPTELAVLIQGETGTGKELIARALYRHSARAHGPFVVLNCGAIPASLIESELFGCKFPFHRVHRPSFSTLPAPKSFGFASPDSPSPPPPSISGPRACSWDIGLELTVAGFTAPLPPCHSLPCAGVTQ